MRQVKYRNGDSILRIKDNKASYNNICIEWTYTITDYLKAAYYNPVCIRH